MTPEEIAIAAINQLNEKITDEIFLIIQKDRKLMHKYLRAVETTKLDNLNQTIGKKVKEAYGLENMAGREDMPSSTLIQSYQKLKLK